MKKLFIYQVFGTEGSVLLRTINVHPLFEGILSSGDISLAKFKDLAEVLEPGIPKMRIQVVDL